MDNYLMPALIVASAVLIATINFIFPFAISSLMIIASVVTAYTMIKSEVG